MNDTLLPKSNILNQSQVYVSINNACTVPVSGCKTSREIVNQNKDKLGCTCNERNKDPNRTPCTPVSLCRLRDRRIAGPLMLKAFVQ